MNVNRDTRIKGHLDYRAYSNGVIRGPNRGKNYNPEEDAPMYFDAKTERAMVILWVEVGKYHYRPLPFDAANAIASAWGAPEEYHAGTISDPMDVSLENLIMPKGWNRKESDDRQSDKPYICEVCGSRFGSQTWLSRHTKTEHTTERAESCQPV